MSEILYGNVFIQTHISDIRDTVILLITPNIECYNDAQIRGKGINMLSGAAVIDCSVVQNLSWIFDC